MENPWRGLASYEDSGNSEPQYKFCGRDKEIAELTKIVDNSLFVTLYGRTGIGKTSLLNAGVFPLLRMRKYWPIYIRLSQKSSEHSYAEYIIEEVNRIKYSGITVNHTDVEENSLSQDTRFCLWNYFFTTKFSNAEGENIYPVIVLDQFEEIFAVSTDKAKKETTELLSQINVLLSDNYIAPNIEGCSDDTNYRFIASIREDNLYCLEDAIDELSLVNLKENRYRLRPLSVEKAKDVVLIPGKKCIDKDSAQKIAEEAVQLAKDNDGSVSSLILSLICSIMFEKAKLQNSANPNIDMSMLPSNQNDTDEVLCNFYLQHTSKKQRKVIEEEMLTADGHRRPSSSFIPNEEDLLSEGVRILQKIETATGTQTEIVHDRLAKVIYMHKRKQDSHRFRNLLRCVVSFILFCFLGIAVVASWTRSSNSSYIPLISIDTNRGASENGNCLLFNTETVEDSVLYSSKNSDVDTIVLGEKVSNIGKLELFRKGVYFKISPNNPIYKWDYLWTLDSGIVGYLSKKAEPSEILYAQKDLQYSKKYRLPKGIDTLHYYGSIITHSDGLPRYGETDVVIENHADLGLRNDDKIENVTISGSQYTDDLSFCKNIRKVTFTADSIGMHSSFNSYAQLTEVHFPKKVRNINGQSGPLQLVNNCPNLTTVTLPDEIIGGIDLEKMFYFCPSIKKFIIGEHSKFKFDNDSILYYDGTPVYDNLCTQRGLQRFDTLAVDFWYVLADGSRWNSYSHMVDKGVVVHNDRPVNIMDRHLQKGQYGYTTQDYWCGRKDQGRNNDEYLLYLRKETQSIHMPAPFKSKSLNFEIIGHTTSLKEIHTSVADPQHLEFSIHPLPNEKITLFVPYGCSERYILSGKFADYKIQEDSWFSRVWDTITYHSDVSMSVFNRTPYLHYGGTILVLTLLFLALFTLRKKQMLNNGLYNIKQCILAGVLGVIVAIIGYIPVYNMITISFANHVNNPNVLIVEVIAVTLAGLSSIICIYLFVFAGNGEIWNTSFPTVLRQLKQIRMDFKNKNK